MKIEDYSMQALSTIMDGHDTADMDPQLLSFVFGLVGESGEVAEKFKKLIRDKQGKISDEDKAEILKELGDILWYVNAVAHLLGSDLQQVAQVGLDKVLGRKQRGTQGGSGDNR